MSYQEGFYHGWLMAAHCTLNGIPEPGEVKSIKVGQLAAEVWGNRFVALTEAMHNLRSTRVFLVNRPEDMTLGDNDEP